MIKSQTGRSMVEMLGILAIIGVLSVGGIAGYSKAMIQMKINKTINQITSIATNTRTLYASQSGKGKYLSLCGYDSELEEYNCYMLDNPRLQGLLDDIPEDGKLANGQLYFVGCNAELEESPVSSNGINCESFEIWVGDLTHEECVKLATYDWGNPDSTGLLAVEVAYGKIPRDITPGDIINSCHQEIVRGCTGVPEDNNISFACAGGSIVSVPMPLSVAINACNCPDNDCHVFLFYE